jgi:hypothetical protein
MRRVKIGAADRRTTRLATTVIGASVAAVTVAAMTVAGAAMPATAGAAGHRAAPAASLVSSGHPATACPPAPPAPKPSSAYKLDGQVWDSADPIDWTLDTTGLTAGGIKARQRDITRALADAAKETGFDFVYKGQVTRIKSSPPRFLLQFAYVEAITGPYAGSLGMETSAYLPGKRPQTVDGVVTLLTSLGWGFGAYNPVHPAHSPEGDVLLHQIGAVVGLDTIGTSPPEVMSSPASGVDYFSGYQAGDEMGLWKVGASTGCAGFPT